MCNMSCFSLLYTDIPTTGEYCHKKSVGVISIMVTSVSSHVNQKHCPGRSAWSNNTDKTVAIIPKSHCKEEGKVISSEALTWSHAKN